MVNVAEIAGFCGCAKPSKDGFICLCPAHHDRKPSLKVWVHNGSARFYCYAGCPSDLIAEILQTRGVLIGPRPRHEKRERWLRLRREARP